VSGPSLSAAQYAELSASWQDDSPVPAAAASRLTLELASLRELSRVRRQVRAFLTASAESSAAMSAPALAVAVEDLIEKAILVIDELASNALRHGTPPSSLLVCDEPARWIIIVTDSAPELVPLPAVDRPAGQGGYGLYVIADLTAAHGVHYLVDRKLVWVCIEKLG